MNIDFEIVARALDKAGQEPLTDEEKETKGSTRWRVIKDFYLAVILEALSNTAWTSQKKRARLNLSEEENLTTYRFMYELPIDCAKPDALLGDGDYLVEDGFLYTDTEKAILVYVGNGFTGKYKYKEADPQPAEIDFGNGEYYTYSEETEDYIKADDFETDTKYYVIEEEDYPFYEDPKLDPQLSAYIETKLAADIVLKITGEAQLYQLLYNEAALMESRAIRSSTAHGHNRDRGDKWWGEILGMPDYGDLK